MSAQPKILSLAGQTALVTGAAHGFGRAIAKTLADDYLDPNVVDAIKWVLGDQRAKSLRGIEMTDVIFKGAEGRDAMGMAEVTMTFEDPQGRIEGRSEVDIGRRSFGRRLDGCGQGLEQTATVIGVATHDRAQRTVRQAIDLETGAIAIGEAVGREARGQHVVRAATGRLPSSRIRAGLSDCERRS